MNLDVFVSMNPAEFVTMNLVLGLSLYGAWAEFVTINVVLGQSLYGAWTECGFGMSELPPSHPHPHPPPSFYLLVFLACTRQETD